MTRKSRTNLKIWFRLMTGLLFFMMVPHKSTAIEHPLQPVPGQKTIKLKKTNKPMRESVNPQMQRMLEQRIASLNLTRAAKDGKQMLQSMLAVGTLISGFFADLWGIPFVFVLSGIITLIAAGLAMILREP